MGAIAGSAAEQIGVLQVNTGTASSTPLAGTAVKFDKVGKMLFLFLLGDMAAETIDCAVETCDSNGANAAALKAATQLGASASANDNKQVVIGVEVNDIVASGKQHVRGKITTGAGVGGTCTIICLGIEGRNGPASGYDNASVAQIVA